MQDVLEMLKDSGQEPPLQHGRRDLRLDEPAIYTTTAVGTEVNIIFKLAQLG